jgi:hypothetical protein
MVSEKLLNFVMSLNQTIIMENISLFTKILFFVTTLLTVAIFYRASRSRNFLIIASVWTAVQLLIGLTDFYTNTSVMPPRVGLLVIPPFVLTILLFTRPVGRLFIQSLNLKTLTLLHTVRIPVEVVLYLLFVGKTIPVIMTFEGRNFDILAGLTAPIVYYLVFVKQVFGRKFLIAWNLICLCLLTNIVLTAVFSFESPFQQFGFEQPNIAIAHAPFNLLPAVIVALVLFSHLVVLWRLAVVKESLQE